MKKSLFLSFFLRENVKAFEINLQTPKFKKHFFSTFFSVLRSLKCFKKIANYKECPLIE